MQKKDTKWSKTKKIEKSKKVVKKSAPKKKEDLSRQDSQSEDREIPKASDGGSKATKEKKDKKGEPLRVFIFSLECFDANYGNKSVVP